MYHGTDDPRHAQRSRETLPGFSPEATARSLLSRIRKLLDAYAPGMPLERRHSPDGLAAALSDPLLERERLFALGWLYWLNDDLAAAESLLSEAMRLAREQNALESLAESAYWRSRVRLLLGRGEAVTEFETTLRSLGGSPRATVWFVDLLGRAGRVDRAEQVWKSVRGNRRVASCVEGPLLEARLLLRRDELISAERLLIEATPTNGVVWVERLLLLAWIAASQRQAEKAREWLHQANEGPYPASALRNWTAKVEQRLGSEKQIEVGGCIPAALQDFVVGQRARREGRIEEARTAYRAALTSPIAQPFARYAAACLEQEDIAGLLASQPGLFLAVRCRARLTLERFRRREANPAEYLDALRLAAAHGYQEEAAEHFRRLAVALQPRNVEANAVRELAVTPCTDAVGRNAFRAALELAVRRLAEGEARELLLEWAKRTDLTEDFRSLVERQLLRLSLRTSDERPALPVDSPALRLWNAAQRLDPQALDAEHRCDEVRDLRSHPLWKGATQALLLHEAAQRGDAAAVVALLEDTDAWRVFQTPPRFALRALASIVVAQPTFSGWRRGLARWLPLWEPTSLGSYGTILVEQAGLTPVRADTAEPPPDVPAAPWLLHRAARALAREDATEVLAFTRRALALDPNCASDVVREALPHLEHRARAQALAGEGQPAGVLADAVQALAEIPDGAAVLDALDAGDTANARSRLETLSERPDLSPRLAHHLALMMQRIAHDREERDDAENAEPYWRRAWLCWLRFLRASDAVDRRLFLDYSMKRHRHRINELLARNSVDAARRHWNLVRDLPACAAEVEAPLGDDLAARLERFREELATEYLLTTRESMRFGVVPNGWRADYEKGLTYLRRLLSLDRDNPRLLTPLVEICNDWFLDLYHQNDAATLRTQLERFTPFALQLARRIDERPGDLTARAALSDFWKFRGFLVADREQKIAFYREALRFNPANDNVRDLLAEKEGL